MYYIKRHKYGVLVKGENQEKILSTSLIKYINELCLSNMSTYEGRCNAAKFLLRENKNLPIYINDKIILYSIKSVRDYNTVLVNYLTVLSVIKVTNTLSKLIFSNLEEIIVDCSYQKIMKRHSQIRIIIGYLNNQVI